MLPIQAWTPKHKKFYKWLFNYIITLPQYKDAKIENYIETYKHTLLNTILLNNEWNDGTKEQLIFIVARYLNNNNDEPYYKLYSNEGHKLTIKIQNKEEENKQDEKELENYREQQYFKNILDELNDNDINDITNHYKYLLLCLLVYQPPLRTSFYSSAKFILNMDENDDINNFMYIDIIKNKCFYIVNDDKAKNYPTYKNNINLSFISIMDNKLKKIIFDSYKKFNRVYLFEHNGQPITNNTLLKYLRDITQTKKINFDIMRSSYINNFYDGKKTMTQKKKLSYQMRHSPETAERNYLKIMNDDNNDNNDNNDNSDTQQQINQHKKLLELENLNNELQLKLSAYKTNDDINDTKFKKRKNDILYLLNNKNKEVKQNTLLKYDINYNDELKKYV
jgi:hypothetical protein